MQFLSDSRRVGIDEADRFPVLIPIGTADRLMVLGFICSKICSKFACVINYYNYTVDLKLHDCTTHLVLNPHSLGIQSINVT